MCPGQNPEGATIMHLLRVLYQHSERFVNLTTTLCRGASMALRRWRQEKLLEAQEAERIDRIRNPSKYLGKSQE